MNMFSLQISQLCGSMVLPAIPVAPPPPVVDYRAKGRAVAIEMGKARQAANQDRLLLSLQDKPLASAQIMEATGFCRETVRQATRRLQTAGRIKQVRIGCIIHWTLNKEKKA